MRSGKKYTVSGLFSRSANENGQGEKSASAKEWLRKRKKGGGANSIKGPPVSTRSMGHARSVQRDGEQIFWTASSGLAGEGRERQRKATRGTRTSSGESLLGLTRLELSCGIDIRTTTVSG